ncbi:MAG: F510_1955 family glycosylhydrolase [Solirubrobacteraceae bacterium]
MSFKRTLLISLALLAGLLVQGCGGDGDSSQRQSTTVESLPETPEEAGLQHIHGLGVRDKTLYIATHTGLWTAPEGQTKARRLGASQQDVMGFSVLDEARFIGSGHPDPTQQDQPPNLGLIESRDGGQSWKNISLAGQADFHVLESSGSRVYGFNGATGRLMVSSDEGRSWKEQAPPAGVYALAIDPSDPDRIVASTEKGVFSSTDAGNGWRPLDDRLAGLLAWPRPNQLYLVDGQGQVRVSDDGGRNWQDVGTIGGQPAAFIADGSDLYAARADGTVKRSTDDGRTWTVRATP